MYWERLYKIHKYYDVQVHEIYNFDWYALGNISECIITNSISITEGGKNNVSFFSFVYFLLSFHSRLSSIFLFHTFYLSNPSSFIFPYPGIGTSWSVLINSDVNSLFLGMESKRLGPSSHYIWHSTYQNVSIKIDDKVSVSYIYFLTSCDSQRGKYGHLFPSSR